MKHAEDALEAAFAGEVEAQRRRRASLTTLRDAILAIVGRDAAAQDVERARSTEAQQPTGKPPALPGH